MLGRLAAAARPPLWVACPDVVADARTTRALWRTWAPVITAHGLVPAYVLQDGQRIQDLPDARAWFIGGSTAWKESRHVWDLVAHVRGRDPGCRVHMGRCCSKRSTGFSRWGDANLLRAIVWIREMQEQPVLWRLT